MENQKSIIKSINKNQTAYTSVYKEDNDDGTITEIRFETRYSLSSLVSIFKIHGPSAFDTYNYSVAIRIISKANKRDNIDIDVNITEKDMRKDFKKLFCLSMRNKIDGRTDMPCLFSVVHRYRRFINSIKQNEFLYGRFLLNGM